MVKNRKFYEKISRDEYFKIEALNQSDLGLMDISPKHYFNRADLRRETPAMQLGTLLHLAVLEPQKFKDQYLLEPEHIKGEAINRRIKAHREYLENFRLDNLDKVIVSNEQYESLMGMLKSISEEPELRPLLSGGHAEIGATWEYRGLKCKGLADYLVDHPQYGRIIVDLKKTQDASVSGFSRSIYNYRYWLQSAFYSLGFEAKEFMFVAIEDKAPYAIGIYKADPSLVEYGTKKMDKLIDKLIECEKTKTWHGYTKGVENIALPAWVAAHDDEKI